MYNLIEIVNLLKFGYLFIFVWCTVHIILLANNKSTRYAYAYAYLHKINKSHGITWGNFSISVN